MLYYAFTDNPNHPTGVLDRVGVCSKTPDCLAIGSISKEYLPFYAHKYIVQVEVIGRVLSKWGDTIEADSVYVHSVEPFVDWLNKQSEAMQIMCARSGGSRIVELISEPSEALQSERKKLEKKEEARKLEREARENMSRLNRCVIV
jgi:hypothetical protein